jgi:hypothetical protein
VHFLLLGALLFLVWAAFGRDMSTADRIVITQGRIATLVELFQRTWQRPPTPTELQGLLDDYVREEVAYREALAMGLDRDDTIIRRRLRQKLEFVVEDLASTAQPTEQELADYLAAHPESFRQEPRLTFEHVYLSTDRRGESARGDAERLKSELERGADPAQAGDPFVLPLHFEAAHASEVARSFGDAFAAEVLALEAGGWRGPVESSYGLHLVRLEARDDGRLPDLAEVRDEVAGEWAAAKRREASEAFYRRLAERYDIRVEEAPSATSDSETTGTEAERGERDPGTPKSGGLP